MKEKIKKFILKVGRSPWYPVGLAALTFIFGLAQIFVGMVLLFAALIVLAVVDNEDRE